MRKLNQQGAASILSVVIFAIIITIVVTAYIRSAIVQQAQSYNFDSSTRAFYAAESGIQDAVRAVNAVPTTTKTTCAGSVPSGNGILNSAFNLSYSCQLIDVTPSSIAFDVKQNKNATVKLRPVDSSSFDNSYKLIVRWSSKGSGVFKARSNVASLPSEENWKDGDGVSFHPMLRASLLSYPLNTPNVTIDQKVTFMNPVDQSTGGGDMEVDFVPSAPYSKDKLISRASCYDSDSASPYDGYLCQEVITIKNLPLDSNGLAIRLHSIYGATDVQLSLTKNGIPASLQGGAAQIDVTGKSGNTLRRVRQTYNLNNGVEIDNLPEAAVIGGDGICKNYSITDKSNEFSDLGNCFN